VEGELSWKGKKLFFVPVAGWTAGIRYTLVLSGSLYSRDGRELKVDIHVPFYAINHSAVPLVVYSSPGNGASTGVLPEETRVELLFSVPMDRLSVETAFAIDGFGNKKFTWAEDDKLFTVEGEKALSPWTVHHWSLGENAKSRDGVPLARSISAGFVTDLDRELPCVVSVYPAIESGGLWFFTGGSMETDLGPGQGIAVEFSKPMGENVLHSLRFDPSLPGRTEQLSPSSIVFIPDRDPEPELNYTLTVSGDTQDAGGLKMAEDRIIHFTADIPFLKILSFKADSSAYEADGGSVFEPSVSAGLLSEEALKVHIDSAGSGALRFTLRFSLVLSDDAKRDASFRIKLDPYFPGTLAPPNLRFVSWIGADRLRMEWEGLETGSIGEAHYYKLFIPGGKGGINNGGGMFFKEDSYLYLEAIN
jgi:hypothetical protein